MSRFPLLLPSLLVLLILLTARPVLALPPASTAPNILFYGNSFTLNGGSGITVPQILQRIAVAAGVPQPTTTNASTSGASLANHLQSNTGVITHGNPVWDFVVLQEYSTKPTNIAGIGNPTEFRNNAQSLYEKVRAQSPGVTPVLFETWSRSPKNATELHQFYPGGSTLFAKASLMQAELRGHYAAAQAQLGPAGARLAPVGDAFEDGAFADSLYNPDNYHSSNKGALLASLVLYDTIYSTHSQSIPYASMTAALGGLATPAQLGIGTPAEWNNLKALADGAVTIPEPGAMALAGLMGGVLRRRRPRPGRPGGVCRVVVCNP